MLSTNLPVEQALIMKAQNSHKLTIFISTFFFLIIWCYVLTFQFYEHMYLLVMQERFQCLVKDKFRMSAFDKIFRLQIW